MQTSRYCSRELSDLDVDTAMDQLQASLSDANAAGDLIKVVVYVNLIYTCIQICVCENMITCCQHTCDILVYRITTSLFLCMYIYVMIYL